ncbi:dihydroorotase, mitochondrial-like isoform X2 [Panicum miliaceum]|uniref:dihydroorotase n=1 Tax=Panicum miliaceum TaxID=4540 RepID=A0A3L6QW47_PANMI|nr:dihydroorotase, mitochondrial-like isoform X2 [Panicum miliaceum]
MQAAITTTTTTVCAHPHTKPSSAPFLRLSPPCRVSFRASLLPNLRATAMAATSQQQEQLVITRPDDWHLHIREGGVLEAVLPHSARHFGRAIIMPNLKPPVTTMARAVEYREEIMRALPPGSSFVPLMTLYLTDNTSPEEIKLARKSGVVFAVKLYPAGATTNSQDGVADIGKCLPVLEEMVRQEMPLLVHGEVTDPHVDTFDREKVFIDKILSPLVQNLPQLKIVMEHITTMDAVNFIESCEEGAALLLEWPYTFALFNDYNTFMFPGHVAATVTPQHLLLNRNALFQGGLQPHNYCLPVLKREIHRQAIVSAVTSGSRRYFLGTDSAPHDKRNKECSCGCAGIYSAPVALSLYAKVFEEAGALDKLEAFTSFNGPDFYGLPRNTSKIVLRKSAWKVPATYKHSSGEIVPMFTGSTLDWLPSDQPEE